MKSAVTPIPPVPANAETQAQQDWMPAFAGMSG